MTSDMSSNDAKEAGFSLDPQLEAETLPVGDLPLSRILLMNDRRYPWFIMVPRRSDPVEITDLTEEDAQTLMQEIRLVATALQNVMHPDKINVAALGNVTRQLHVHVIARFHSDPAWPRPIWGIGEQQAYPSHAAFVLIDRMRDQLVAL